MAIRDIIFRGKRLDNGEWVESGSLLRTKNEETGEFLIFLGSAKPAVYIFNTEKDIVSATSLDECVYYRVDPTTVCQFTGLTANGKKIFEGDIVNILGNQESADWKNVNYNALIAFLDGGFCAIDGTIENYCFRRYALARMDFDLEVIGNIHDNPELLEGEK